MKSSSQSQLRGKRALLLSHLLAGEKLASAASFSSVAERTAYRWLSEPGFREELKRQQALIIESTSGQLLALGSQAVEALKQVLEQPQAPGANVKRLAALSVLELMLKYREALSLEHRIHALETIVINWGET